MGLHVIDFRLLSKSGSGNAWVSPQFQMTLKGHDVLPVMAGKLFVSSGYVFYGPWQRMNTKCVFLLCVRIDIAWDSKVHIRHANTNGGWVHSMPGEYSRETSKGKVFIRLFLIAKESIQVTPSNC
jgi:dolichyl-phosphate-mannose-protein mannosyltransferase